MASRLCLPLVTTVSKQGTSTRGLSTTYAGKRNTRPRSEASGDIEGVHRDQHIQKLTSNSGHECDLWCFIGLNSLLQPSACVVRSVTQRRAAPALAEPLTSEFCFTYHRNCGGLSSLAPEVSSRTQIAANTVTPIDVTSSQPRLQGKPEFWRIRNIATGEMEATLSWSQDQVKEIEVSMGQSSSLVADSKRKLCATVTSTVTSQTQLARRQSLHRLHALARSRRCGREHRRDQWARWTCLELVPI